MFLKQAAAASRLTTMWTQCMRFASQAAQDAFRVVYKRGALATTSCVGRVDSRVGTNMKTDFPGAMRLSGLTQRQAEEVLDWLENHGVRDSLVEYVTGQGFTIWHG